MTAKRGLDVLKARLTPDELEQVDVLFGMSVRQKEQSSFDPERIANRIKVFDIINEMVTWAHTPQGSEYWSNISRKYIG